MRNHRNKARIVALAVGALSAAVLTAAAPAAPAVPGASGQAAGTPPHIVIRPGIIRLAAAAQATPFTTAQCERQFRFACYQPGQLRAAYHLPALYQKKITGADTTIVIVDPFGSPAIRHDLATFDRQFGYRAPPSFKIITPAGKIPPYDPHNPGMVGAAGETTLDVDWAHALAPGANILLAETPAAETEGAGGFPQIVRAEKYVIDHGLGDVISQSFAATEQTFTSYQQLKPLRAAYVDAASHHLTVVSSDGDHGATDVNARGAYYLHPVTSWPGSDPLVTAVGGTRLVRSNGTFIPVAWNETFSKAVNEHFTGGPGPNPIASGGGKSVFFARPSYQDGVKSVVGGRRGDPDISMSAACNGAVQVYASFGGVAPGWALACGNSEATPEFAAIVALADQVAGHPLGLINPRLYALSARHAPGIVDVTSGNNTVSFHQGTPEKLHTVQGFPAGKGYDLVTGVGTVNAPSFVYELAGRLPARVR